MKYRFATALLFSALILLASREAFSREDYGAVLEKDCEVCHIDRYYPGGSFIDAEESYKWKIFWVFYPPQEMDGPPFAVSAAEVDALFASSFHLEPLGGQDILAENPRFQARGLSYLQEEVYRLVRR